MKCFLHCMLLVDFNRSWFLVLRLVSIEVPSRIQTLGLIPSGRREESSTEPSTSCSALSVPLRF